MFRKKKSKKLVQIPEIRMEVPEGCPEEGVASTGVPVVAGEGAAGDIVEVDEEPVGVACVVVGSATGGGRGKRVPPPLAKDSPVASPCPSPTGPLSPLSPLAHTPSPSPSASLCSVTFTGVMSEAVDPKDKVRFSKHRLSASSPADDDEDYSASLDELLRRRESGRRRSIRRSPKRGSSPMGSDSDRSRRRSSTMTSGSCDETAVSIEEPEMTEEQMFESIRLHKEVVDGMKKQPWRMKKRLLVVRQAKAYVKKHECELEQRLAQSKSTKDIMARYHIIFLRYWQRIKREAVNLAQNLVPWEMRIKQIESLILPDSAARGRQYWQWLSMGAVKYYNLGPMLDQVSICHTLNLKMTVGQGSCMGAWFLQLFPCCIYGDVAHEMYCMHFPSCTYGMILVAVWWSAFGHFGSVVASYFTFLRWVFWINIVMSVFIACFMMVPEVLATDRAAAGDRKELLPDEQASAFNLQKLWDFEGFLKYTPIFYGYYSNKDKTKEGYRLPFAYFMTSLGVYAYSFVAILRKMAENSRMSKLSDKDDECVFTWKLFTGWDYMIGASETADNKIASLLMGFKESILEERQKKEEPRNWKIIGMRVLANIIVLILLASSAYAVVLVVQRSKEPEADDNWWRQNEVTVIVSLISTLYPNLFDAIGLMEKFHPRVQLRWQLARILVLYLLNLYTLIFSLFGKVDDMSSKLFSLKPNTTAAPFTTTTSSSLGEKSSSGPTLSPLFNETIFPFSNITMVTLLSALSLNSTGLDIIFSNSTCVAFRAECLTGRALSPGSENPCKLNATTPYPVTMTTLTDQLNVTDTFNWDDNMSLPNYTFPGEIHDDVVTNYSADVPRSQALVYLPPEVLEKFTPDPPRAFLEFNMSRTGRTMGPKWKSEDAKRAVDVRPQSDSPIQMATFNSTTATWTRTYSDSSRPIAVALPEEDTVAPDAPSSVSPSDEFSPPSLDLDGSEEYTGVHSWLKTLSPNCCVILTCLEGGDGPTSTPYSSDTGLTPDDRGSLNVTVENATEPAYDVTNSAGLDFETRKKLRTLCWETMFGQELVKLTIMDIVFTTISILITDFIRAVVVRVMNHCCCCDLEKNFPGYGDFKIAENILHLVNNQGMIWMGMFFAPGLPAINMVKLVLLMYLRSWAVLTCNIPHETVFRASRSNNFYYLLLLTMCFLCTLPVGYAIVWLDPSWHCGPFSQYSKIYQIFTTSISAILPDIISRALVYVASPGIIIPFLVLLILVIYYLISLSNSLRESNKDLKDQLRRERTEERKKVFQMADSRHDAPSTDADSKWTAMKKILPVMPSKVKMLHLAAQEMRQLAKSSSATQQNPENALKSDNEKALEAGVPIGLVKAARLLSKARGVAIPQTQVAPNVTDENVANVHKLKSEQKTAADESVSAETELKNLKNIRKLKSDPKKTEEKAEEIPEVTTASKSKKGEDKDPKKAEDEGQEDSKKKDS